MNDDIQYGGLIDRYFIKTLAIVFGVITLVFLLIQKLSNLMWCQFFNICQVTGVTSYTWVYPVSVLSFVVAIILILNSTSQRRKNETDEKHK